MSTSSMGSIFKPLMDKAAKMSKDKKKASVKASLKAKVKVTRG